MSTIKLCQARTLAISNSSLSIQTLSLNLEEHLKDNNNLSIILIRGRIILSNFTDSLHNNTNLHKPPLLSLNSNNLLELVVLQVSLPLVLIHLQLQLLRRPQPHLHLIYQVYRPLYLRVNKANSPSKVHKLLLQVKLKRKMKILATEKRRNSLFIVMMREVTFALVHLSNLHLSVSIIQNITHLQLTS